MRYEDWIPTSERLPKKDGRYICTLEGCYNVLLLEFSYGKFLNEYTGADITKKVIAWQPLPPLYKEV